MSKDKTEDNVVLNDEKTSKVRSSRKIRRHLSKQNFVIFSIILGLMLLVVFLVNFKEKHKYDSLPTGVHVDLVPVDNSPEWKEGKKYDEFLKIYSVEGKLVRFDMDNNWVIIEINGELWKVNYSDETKYYSNNFTTDDKKQVNVTTELYKTELAFFHHIKRGQWIRIDCANIVCTDAVGVINYNKD